MGNAAPNNQLCDGKDKVFNFRPIAFAAVCLCLGIFLGYACSVYQFSHGWLFIGVLIFGTPFFFVSNKTQLRQALKSEASAVNLPFSVEK